MRNLSATICLAIAVFLGSVGVSESAIFQKGLTAFENKDYATARHILEPLARTGHTQSQYYMYLIFLRENGLFDDMDAKKKVARYLMEAGDKGYAPAEWAIGDIRETRARR